MAKYCANCGNEVNETQAVCLQCGHSLKTENRKVDEGSTFGWAVLGFFVPVVGLVLYLVWKDERPRVARSAGKGALISVILGFIYMAFVMTIMIPAIGNQL